jgi:hypothetical protein
MSAKGRRLSVINLIDRGNKNLYQWKKINPTIWEKPTKKT